MRLFIMWIIFCRAAQARSATQKSCSCVCARKSRKSSFSSLRKMSCGRGRIRCCQICWFHSGKALISAATASQMQSRMSSAGISLRCLSILARMQCSLSLSSARSSWQRPSSLGLKRRASFTESRLQVSMNSSRQQAMKMVSKKVQAALATRGVSQPMYSRHWSMSGPSRLLLSTMEALQTKKRLFMPMKSSSRKEYFSMLPLLRCAEDASQKRQYRSSRKGSQACSRQKTVMATSTRQTQEQTGDTVKACITVSQSQGTNSQNSSCRQRMRCLTSLTARSISEFSSTWVAAVLARQRLMKGKLSRTNSLTTQRWFWTSLQSLRNLAAALSEYMHSRRLDLLSCSTAFLRSRSVLRRCASMDWLLLQMMCSTPLTMCSRFGQSCTMLRKAGMSAAMRRLLTSQPLQKVLSACSASSSESKQVELQQKSFLMRMSFLTWLLISDRSTFRKVFLTITGVLDSSISSLKVLISSPTSSFRKFSFFSGLMRDSRQTSRLLQKELSLWSSSRILLQARWMYFSWVSSLARCSKVQELFSRRLQTSSTFGCSTETACSEAVQKRLMMWEGQRQHMQTEQQSSLTTSSSCGERGSQVCLASLMSSSRKSSQKSTKSSQMLKPLYLVKATRRARKASASGAGCAVKKGRALALKSRMSSRYFSAVQSSFSATSCSTFSIRLTILIPKYPTIGAFSCGDRSSSTITFRHTTAPSSSSVCRASSSRCIRECSQRLLRMSALQERSTQQVKHSTRAEFIRFERPHNSCPFSCSISRTPCCWPSASRLAWSREVSSRTSRELSISLAMCSSTSKQQLQSESSQSEGGQCLGVRGSRYLPRLTSPPALRLMQMQARETATCF